MHTMLTNLLQDADPVRHELPLASAERERMRQATLREVAAGGPALRPRVRARLALVVAVALALIGAAGLAREVWLTGPTPLLAAVRFEVRLAEESPVAGLVVAQLSDSSRLIYLHPEIVVSNDDIAQSWVSEDASDRASVFIQLTPSGADRLRQATAGHLNRPLAILIDGRVVMAPVVRSPIGDSALMTGGFSRAEAERIVEGMKLR